MNVKSTYPVAELYPEKNIKLNPTEVTHVLPFHKDELSPSFHRISMTEVCNMYNMALSFEKPWSQQKRARTNNVELHEGASYIHQNPDRTTNPSTGCT